VLDDECESAPSVGSEPLEARKLRLDRDARGTGRVDQRLAVGCNRGGGSLRRRAALALVAARPKMCRVWIEPEDDLRLTLSDCAGKTIAVGAQLSVLSLLPSKRCQR
jgi:hypothetical protein